MDTDTLLALLDDESRGTAFKQCLSTLETAPQINIDALRMCIKLWTPLQSSSGATDQLIHLLMLKIPCEPMDTDCMYRLAEILCTNGPFAHLLFRERIYPDLAALLSELSKIATGDSEDSAQQILHKAAAYLALLKSSYWLPSYYNHVVGPGLLDQLSAFLGIPVLDDNVLDTISAFLSLLKRGFPVSVASPRGSIQSWQVSDDKTGHVVLAGPIVDGRFWDKLSTLEPTYFAAGRSFVLAWLHVYPQHTIALPCRLKPLCSAAQPTRSSR
jgi:tRNA guanosine-2'-O-methyltransferase